MSPFHRNSPYFSLVTLGLGGLLAILFGALAMESRHSLAANFLGGRFFLGLPLDRVDSYKLLAVFAASVQVGLIGVAMIFVGILLSVSRLSKDRSFSIPSDASASSSQGGLS